MRHSNALSLSCIALFFLASCQETDPVSSPSLTSPYGTTTLSARLQAGSGISDSLYKTASTVRVNLTAGGLDKTLSVDFSAHGCDIDSVPVGVPFTGLNSGNETVWTGTAKGTTSGSKTNGSVDPNHVTVPVTLPKASDSALSSLSTNPGFLSPTFSADSLRYVDSVPAGTSSILVSTIADYSNDVQSIKINGDTATRIGLEPGQPKTIAVKVTNLNQNSLTYTIQVYFRKPVVTGTLQDPRDGRNYPTVVIGTQTWMANNLNFHPDSGSWCSSTTDTTCSTAGRLYTWTAATSACPTGWHLPSADEWNQLQATVGGYDFAGRTLKAKSSLWPSNTGTDEFGFAAIPSSYFYNGSLQTDSTTYGDWWTSTPDTQIPGNALYRYITDSYDNLTSSNYEVGSGLSVRCVKN